MKNKHNQDIVLFYIMLVVLLLLCALPLVLLYVLLPNR